MGNLIASIENTHPGACLSAVQVGEAKRQNPPAPPSQESLTV